jgi:hypothetical protein
VIEWTSDNAFRIGAVEFAYAGVLPFGADGPLQIGKPRPLVEAYERLLAPFESPRIVELGSWQGGSTALFALIAKPAKLVAIDLLTQPLDRLDAVVAAQGLEDVVRCHAGVDQADSAQLASIVDDDMHGEPIDVVIDDASHWGPPTRSAFEVLFPRMAPGGLYVIENWTWELAMGGFLARYATADVLADPDRFGAFVDGGLTLFQETNAPAESSEDRSERFVDNLISDMDGEDDERPYLHVFRRAAAGDDPPWPEGMPAVPTLATRKSLLVRFVFELIMASVLHPGIVADVVTERSWVLVRRGPAPLEPDGFRLDDLPTDFLGLLRD